MNGMNEVKGGETAGIVNLDDFEIRARERLDANAWAYLAGGAGDERTLRANREAWAAPWLQPRVLRRLAQGHTRIELFGRSLAHPVLIAPVAYQRLAHDSGEIGTALAAAAQAPAWCSARSRAHRWKTWRGWCGPNRNEGRCGSSSTCRATAAAISTS